MAPHEAEALRHLERVAATHERPLLAYSGGKDAIVTAHLALAVGITEAVCEVSWYFERQLRSVQSIAAGLGLQVAYRDSVPLSVLRAHPEMIFSDDPKVRAWTFAMRQQATVKRHARQAGYDCQIFGRRTQENSVRAPYYVTAAGAQCHPIRSWTTAQVWEYIERHRLPVPWIYGTAFGKAEGNAPFYTMRARDHGGLDGCWRLASALDPRYTRKEILG